MGASAFHPAGERDRSLEGLERALAMEPDDRALLYNQLLVPESESNNRGHQLAQGAKQDTRLPASETEYCVFNPQFARTAFLVSLRV
jgi:hypothetical protein